MAVNSDQTAQTQAGNATLQLVSLSQAASVSSYVLDELRYGTTLPDVVAVPEPATLGLFAGMGVVMFAVRRLLIR